MDSKELITFIRTFRVRKNNGFEGIKIEIVQVLKFNQPDAREYEGCNVVVSGGVISTAFWSQDTVFSSAC